MLYSYYLGLDPGQSQDYTALSLVEEPCWIAPEWSHGVPVLREQVGWISPAELNPRQAEKALSLAYHRGRPPHPVLSVRHLERFELGTRYPVVVERVMELLESAPLRGKRVAFLIDRTGVGAPVVDAFLQAGMRPIAISIHGGSAVSRDRDGYRVPKRDLVSATQVLLQNARLKIAEGLELAPVLRKELLNFRAKISPMGHDSYEHWREGDHDDLVLATTMPCWFRQWRNQHLEAAYAHVARKRAG